MAYRGWFALNGVELVNSSRVIAHLGRNVPTTDVEAFGGGVEGECALEESAYPLLRVPSEDMEEIYSGLWTPPVGSRRYGKGLLEVDGTCWGPASICASCATRVNYDDSWPGLQEFLGDIYYRPELAPWYTTQVAESAEFGGIWVMDVKGLDSTPGERQISQLIGAGGVAGRHRDLPRTITFEALLIGCTNAGVEYGLHWLTCRLRETISNSQNTLKYLTSSPSDSGALPQNLVREMHSIVMSQAPTVTERINPSGAQHLQGSMYRVTWELTALNPYAYMPRVFVPALWDEVERQPVNWIHAGDCAKPETCEDMPIFFSPECTPEEIEVVSSPPPVCGGCLPVGEIDKYSFRLPTMDYPFGCRDTVMSMVVRNTGERDLTIKAFLRIAGTDVRCEDDLFPLTVSGLPPTADLFLDGITGRYWMDYDERLRKPVGVVATPNGAPWRPAVIDRQIPYDLIVQAASYADFEVYLTFFDREP